MDAASPPTGATTITGRHVVLGMLAFGVLMVGALWLYWELYTRPFRELQNAIADEFPGSSPRAIGGRHQSGPDGGPSILRIVVYVDFDPTADESRSIGVAERLADIAREHHDVSRYELLEVHLAQRVPEQATRNWSLSRPVSEWGPPEDARPNSRG